MLAGRGLSAQALLNTLQFLCSIICYLQIASASNAESCLNLNYKCVMICADLPFQK